MSLAAPLEPAGYFGRQGPVGDIFRVFRGKRASTPGGLEVSVIGLGIGSMLAYAQEHDRFFAVELDPQIAALAADPSFFPYVASCGARCELVVGDGRIQLEQSERKAFDIIFLDAFTSDSVPLHLLSIEAVKLYFDRLKEDGVAVFNISNRFFDLRRQLALAASTLGAHALVRENFDLAPEAIEAGMLPSIYLVIVRDHEQLASFQELGWREVTPPVGGRVWTDSFSSLFDARM